MITVCFGNSIIKQKEYDDLDKALIKALELKDVYEYVCVKDVFDNIIIKYENNIFED